MIFFTSIAANYLPKARVLARSVKRHHPGARFALILADTKPAQIDWDKEPFDLVWTIEELGIPNWKPWLFGMRLVEACTAIKPFALQKILEELDEISVYLDPDIAVFAPLYPVLDALRNSSVVFTPHICAPERSREAIEDNEINSLRHGLYNLGFVAVKNDATGLAYARWWAERCYTWCKDDIPRGLFTDQRWNDLVPIFFEHVGIAKNPGLNVATWNYAQRRIEGDFTRGFTVNDVPSTRASEPLYFHHFSGYDSGAHIVMRDKYGADMPAAKLLSEWYEQECIKEDGDRISEVPWAYGCFSNGEAITPEMRRTYSMRLDVQAAMGDPFVSTETEPGYLGWVNHEKWLEQERNKPPSRYHRIRRAIGDTIPGVRPVWRALHAVYAALSLKPQAPVLSEPVDPPQDIAPAGIPEAAIALEPEVPQTEAATQTKPEPEITPPLPPLEIWAEHYAADTRPVFLFVSHDKGGGTEQHVLFLKDALGREGFRVLILRHGATRTDPVFLQGFAPDATERMEFDIAQGYGELVAILRSVKLRHIHVHHTLHMPEGALSMLENLSADLGVPYDFTAHDYLSICPRFTLFQDGHNGYCGEPDIAGCAGCLAAYGSPYGRSVDMVKWRSDYARFLGKARRVMTPNEDVSARLKKYFPAANIHTRPHEEVIVPTENLAGTREAGGPLKVVCIGGIAPYKGAAVIYDCAEDALKRGLDMHFTVIGYTSEDWKRLPYSNMVITGAYTDAQLHDWLKEGQFHLAFFPAVWPETYSYTLSIAMRYGLYPVALGIGALGQRIADSGFGSVLPYGDYGFPSRLNDALLAIRPQTAPADLMEKYFSRYANYVRDYYGLEEPLNA